MWFQVTTHKPSLTAPYLLPTLHFVLVESQPLVKRHIPHARRIQQRRQPRRRCLGLRHDACLHVGGNGRHRFLRIRQVGACARRWVWVSHQLWQRTDDA